MNIRILLAACLCFSMFQGKTFAASTKLAAENTGMDYLKVVSGLPWDFRQSAVSIDDQADQTGKSTRYQFVSIEPLGRTTQPKSYLRAELTETVYASPELAVESFKLIREKADPDMGLSYAWDYLLLEDRTIYHLHTGCMMSEDNFGIMVSNLRQAVPEMDGQQVQPLLCRCGGGCRDAE